MPLGTYTILHEIFGYISVEEDSHIRHVERNTDRMLVGNWENNLQEWEARNRNKFHTYVRSTFPVLLKKSQKVLLDWAFNTNKDKRYI